MYFIRMGGVSVVGSSPEMLVDINALMRFRDKDKQGVPPIKAVFVLFNKAPYAIIARKSRGIRALADLLWDVRDAGIRRSRSSGSCVKPTR